LETEWGIETLTLNISRASLTENKDSKAVSSVSCADVHSSFDSTCTFVINQPITDFPSKMRGGTRRRFKADYYKRFYWLEYDKKGKRHFNIFFLNFLITFMRIVLS
jgi:hypothetical protein